MCSKIARLLRWHEEEEHSKDRKLRHSIDGEEG